MNIDSIHTVGKLKVSGWQSKSVKEEIRDNILFALKTNKDLFEGIIGYDHTVIPQIINALLAKHDILLLGLRGQAKTKILRQLPIFLDEYIPIIKGSEINDDPFRPLSEFGKNRIQEQGDDTPIVWLHRSQRYVEKLATPDTTVADLIGDIDPVKAANERISLSDHRAINFGLIPRANRSLFIINELPDLQPRIQVALLNVLQEKDIQIRGFNIRIPLDISIHFSANPEDYTNRGNIITPLKDRIDAQILTHYPKELDHAIEITSNEAWINRGRVEVKIPHFIKEFIEMTTFKARESEYIDQRSGVSARMSITAMELLISTAEQRSLRNNETETTIRISDLYTIVPALTGKLELVYEGEQEGLTNVAGHLIGKSINEIFKKYFPDPQSKDEKVRARFTKLSDWFTRGNKIDLADNASYKTYTKTLDSVEGLAEFVKLNVRSENKEFSYVMMEFVLEAMHQNSMLSKYEMAQGYSYSDMIGSMLGGIKGIDDDAFGGFTQ